MPARRAASPTWVGFAAVAAAVALSIPGDAVAQGCAMCKTALGGPGDPLSRGINTSIMFMMAMPFVLFAIVGGWLTYAFWRGGREDGGAQTGEQLELDLVYTEREGAR
jgi:hypothetical protein